MHSHLLYAVLREDRCGAPDRSQVEPAVLLASLRYLLAPARARGDDVFRRRAGERALQAAQQWGYVCAPRVSTEQKEAMRRGSRWNMRAKAQGTCGR